MKMTLRKEVEIVNGYLLILWAITLLGGGVLAYGSDLWWTIDAAATTLTRMVFLWFAVLAFLIPWSMHRKLIRPRDLPVLFMTPLFAPGIATLLELSIPHED